MRTSETETSNLGELAKALAAAQSELKNPTRNRTVRVKMSSGGSYSFEYATLDAILDSLRPVLSKHGLALISAVDGSVCTTRLIHTSGQWIETSIPIMVAGSGAQAYGSAITYARRYGISSLLPIAAEEDDDANAAEGNEATKTDHPPKVATPAKPFPKLPTEYSAGEKVKEPTDEDLRSADALRDEIIRLVAGDKGSAERLLVSITAANKASADGSDPFPGFRSTRAMKQEWQIINAWQRLLEHPVYGTRKPLSDEATPDDIAEIFGPDDGKPVVR
jgi:hypothetical protein